MAQEGSNIGLVTSLIAGIAGLVILIIVALLIVNTLLDANLLGSASIVNQTESNETGGNLTTLGYRLGTYLNGSRSNYNITVAYNGSNNFQVIPQGNWSLDTGTGVVKNATDLKYLNVSFTYTWDYRSPEGSQYQVTSEAMGKNLSGGINNISNKIPTILLIGAVVLLFGVIVLLVAQSRRMGIGGGGSSSL